MPQRWDSQHTPYSDPTHATHLPVPHTHPRPASTPHIPVHTLTRVHHSMLTTYAVSAATHTHVQLTTAPHTSTTTPTRHTPDVVIDTVSCAGRTLPQSVGGRLHRVYRRG